MPFGTEQAFIGRRGGLAVKALNCKFRDPGSNPGRAVLSFGLAPRKCKNSSDLSEGAKETSPLKRGWRS